MEKPITSTDLGQISISEAGIEEVVRCLRSGWLGRGPITDRFESEFSQCVGADFSVATSSCTAALQASLLASGVGRGDEVITSSVTYPATINAIMSTGARPVLVDVMNDSFLMNLEQVREKINEATRAVIPVHFGGRLVDLSELCQLAERCGIVVIQDSAHALEARYQGAPLSQFGLASCYSFAPTKSVTTVEGGMVCTTDRQFAKRVRTVIRQGLNASTWERSQGKELSQISYDVVSAGFKGDTNDVHSALGLAQLSDLDKRYRLRKENWQKYFRYFSTTDRHFSQDEVTANRHGYHLFNICVSDREKLWKKCFEKTGIRLGVHFPAISTMSFYKRTMEIQSREFPVAERVGSSILSLPLHRSDWVSAVISFFESWDEPIFKSPVLKGSQPEWVQS